MNDEQMENHRGTDRVPRLERALRESWNKSFQLFHAAARSTSKDGIAEAIRKLDLSILILRYAINNPFPSLSSYRPYYTAKVHFTFVSEERR